jgi:hypothetical protein
MTDGIEFNCNTGLESVLGRTPLDGPLLGDAVGSRLNAVANRLDRSGINFSGSFYFGFSSFSDFKGHAGTSVLTHPII